MKNFIELHEISDSATRETELITINVNHIAKIKPIYRFDGQIKGTHIVLVGTGINCKVIEDYKEVLSMIEKAVSAE